MSVILNSKETDDFKDNLDMSHLNAKPSPVSPTYFYLGRVLLLCKLTWNSDLPQPLVLGCELLCPALLSVKTSVLIEIQLTR